MPMQQQGFPMVSVMQPNMQGMIGMNYSSQMSPGPIAMQVFASSANCLQSYCLLLCVFILQAVYSELNVIFRNKCGLHLRWLPSK